MSTGNSGFAGFNNDEEARRELAIYGGGVPYHYLLIQDQKPPGTGGGSPFAGSWVTRDLNTVVADSGNIATLAANQIRLPPGTYHCAIFCPACYVNSHSARLQNITDGMTTLSGSSGSSYRDGANNFHNTHSIIHGSFTITKLTTFEIQHQVNTSQVTVGFGNPAGLNGGSNVAVEVYTSAEFRKVA